MQPRPYCRDLKDFSACSCETNTTQSNTQIQMQCGYFERYEKGKDFFFFNNSVFFRKIDNFSSFLISFATIFGAFMVKRMRNLHPKWEKFFLRIFFSFFSFLFYFFYFFYFFLWGNSLSFFFMMVKYVGCMHACFVYDYIRKETKMESGCRLYMRYCVEFFFLFLVFFPFFANAVEIIKIVKN